MSTKKYVSLSKLSTFLDNLKGIFATKTEIDTKADTSHTHNDIYYTKSENYSKTEIDEMEFITTSDIDAICGGSIQITSASEVKF